MKSQSPISSKNNGGKEMQVLLLLNSLQNMPYNLENCQVKFYTYIIILSLLWYKRIVETETVQYKPFQNKASWSIIFNLNHNKCLTLILNTKTQGHMTKHYTRGAFVYGYALHISPFIFHIVYMYISLMHRIYKL